MERAADGPEAARDALRVPHELLELHAVCSDVSDGGTYESRRAEFVQD